MKILLTGASSFTGYWFASTLAGAGHTIVAPLTRAADAYEGVRRERVIRLNACAQIVENCPFGSETFTDLVRGGVDVLCHHGAQVAGYKSMDFDVGGALNNNTCNLQSILRIARLSGLKSVILTGSVFEPDEGSGTEPRRAFSPYGLSKALTAQVFRFWCETLSIPLAKFIIPNPFGPWEDERFCAYLLRCWTQGNPATINTPVYVRDNIHVSLLALAYRDLVSRTDNLPQFSRHAPSGYIESQASFAQRFSQEIGRRLDLAAELNLAQQADFLEPPVRVNTDFLDTKRLGWDETNAWDELAAYYRTKLRNAGQPCAHHLPTTRT